VLTPIDPDHADRVLAQTPGVSAELQRMGGHMARLFALEAPESPGLSLAGAVLALSPYDQAAAGMPTMSVTGNGLTQAEALTTCFGEAADTLSQFERRGDIVGSRCGPKLMSGWIEQAACHAEAIDWTLGHDAQSGDTVLLPADICLRRVPAHRAFSPPGALSSGCAAGPSLAHAQARAVFELIERDAAALWWLGGRQGRALAPAIKVEDLIGQLRGNRTGRRIILLDITTDIGVPVVAACSHDHDGHFFACGVACRATLAQASKAAILEMAQMELSAPIAHLKATEQGEAALNPADVRHMARAQLDVSRLPMLVAEVAGADIGEVPDPAAHLGAHGHRLAYVDLTRATFRVPVIRAIAPGLQPFAETLTTPRLAAIIASTGGGTRHHAGIMPF
jgi:thiazole/oxazole-forming peptide maturase SagD family component